MLSRPFLIPLVALIRQQLLHLWRDRNRVLSFTAFPLLFWLVVGSGFGDLGRFYSGALTLALVFSAALSAMSVIEERDQGVLLSALASPSSRLAIVVGKVLGSGLVAWVQGILLLVFLPVAGLHPAAAHIVGVLTLLLLVALACAAAGFLLAWQSGSAHGFHALVNLVFFPLWMLSGTLFEVNQAHSWVKVLSLLNPLTYPTQALKLLLASATPSDNILWTGYGVPGILALGLIGAGASLLHKRSSRGLA